MISFEEMQNAMGDAADALPEEILDHLNGGVILLHEEKLHPKSKQPPLYILGEYHYDPLGLGRYITLYYGSFSRAYGHLPDGDVREQVKKTLYHELTHHLESLAGDRSLEKQDAYDLANYLRRLW